MKSISVIDGVTVARYDSLNDCLPDLHNYQGNYRSEDHRKWAGGTYSNMLKMVVNGNPEGINRISAAFDSSLRPINTSGKKWVLDIGGAYPVIPAYVAGSPMHMRNKRIQPGMKMPIRIFTSICASASFDAAELEKRLVTVAQFVVYLSLTRPVEFYVFADIQGITPVIRVGNSPIDLARLSYLATPAALRRMCFALAGSGFHGGWSNYYGNIERTRKILNASEKDIIIEGALSGSGFNGVTSEEWLNNQMQKYGLLK